MEIAKNYLKQVSLYQFKILKFYEKKYELRFNRKNNIYDD